MEEMGEDELDNLDQADKDKRVKGILSQLKKMDDEIPKPEKAINEDRSSDSDATENEEGDEEEGEDDLSDVSVDSEAKIDAANAMLNELEKKNREDEGEDFEESKL